MEVIDSPERSDGGDIEAIGRVSSARDQRNNAQDGPKNVSHGLLSVTVCVIIWIC